MLEIRIIDVLSLDFSLFSRLTSHFQLDLGQVGFQASQGHGFEVFFFLCHVEYF